MNLYILRHGIAVEPGTPGYEQDSERPLTPEGKRKLALIARAMCEMELAFDLILSSPYTRARQTAEIVARTFRAEKRLAVSKELAVGGNARAVIEELRRRTPAPGNVLLVGHEPYLSSLISMLAAGDTNVAVTLKKGGLCKLSGESLRYGRCASLDWLLTPKLMMRMA